jgi:hypothetical protein
MEGTDSFRGLRGFACQAFFAENALLIRCATPC